MRHLHFRGRKGHLGAADDPLPRHGAVFNLVSHAAAVRQIRGEGVLSQIKELLPHHVIALISVAHLAQR